MHIFLVHLCLKLTPGYRKSYSEVWHISKFPEERKFQRRALSMSRCGGTSSSVAASATMCKDENEINASGNQVDVICDGQT